ncbi:DUF4350 domain-containing protein [Microbacterium kribbense]|uniref:DUF4350 domain-containing protein n=1 Tax=Microbacterium kribbense TaxID=433645 RepID=A0ABP7GR47_9MICO
MTAVLPRPATSARRRHAGVWAAIAVVLVVAGVGGAILSGIGQWTRRDLLDPASTGADGAQALAHILSDHGVDVQIVRTRSAADDALRAAGRVGARPAQATLVLPDSPLLSAKTFQSLTGAAADVVIAQPLSRSVRLRFGSSVTGYGADAPVPPDCPLPAAQRAGAIVPGTLFTVPQRPGVTACYRTGPDAALLQRTTAGTTVTAVDGAALLTNAALAEHGNAALAVNLMGAHRTLIWFVPSADDADAGAAAPTLGSLTPSWVSPAIVLLLLAGIATAVWRGRRFGPLVAENLPVTVRTGETTDGRARLYARSGDRVHVARRLQAGTRDRLARLLGLGPGAAPATVADAAADRLAVPRREVHGILLDSAPRTDRDLLALSDRLQAIETAVRAAVSPTDLPGRTTP